MTVNLHKTRKSARFLSREVLPGRSVEMGEWQCYSYPELARLKRWRSGTLANS